MKKKRNNIRMMNMIVDMIHVVICIAIIVLAILIFMKPMQNTRCYPLVFFMASILNFTNAYAKLNTLTRNKPRLGDGIVAIVFGLVFLLLAIVSALSIWR